MPSAMTLPCGQRVSWLDCGDPQGRPLFFHNGWPGSAEQVVALEALGCELGWRLISLHRPGFGGSTPQPGRGLLDWPPLVAAVADYLGIGKFHLFAVSGGGPYAMATAWALGNRVLGLRVRRGGSRQDSGWEIHHRSAAVGGLCLDRHRQAGSELSGTAEGGG